MTWEEMWTRAAMAEARALDYSHSQTEAFLLGARWARLPLPSEGCACTPAGLNPWPYTEEEVEYEPACPIHSTHLYDPRRGEWVSIEEVRQ